MDLRCQHPVLLSPLFLFFSNIFSFSLIDHGFYMDNVRGWLGGHGKTYDGLGFFLF